MNDPTNPTINVTAEQLLQLCLLDLALANLQTQANQLGGFLKMEEPANIIVAAMKVIAEGKARLIGQWRSGLVIAKPGEVVINGAPR